MLVELTFAPSVSVGKLGTLTEPSIIEIPKLTLSIYLIFLNVLYPRYPISGTFTPTEVTFIVETDDLESLIREVDYYTTEEDWGGLILTFEDTLLLNLNLESETIAYLIPLLDNYHVIEF